MKRLIKSIRFGEKTKINFIEIPDVGGNVKKEIVEMNGISLQYKTTDLDSCLLLGKMPVELCNSPRNDKTPLFNLTSKEPDDGYNTYRQQLKDKINNICYFAEKFIDVERLKIENNDTQNMFEQNDSEGENAEANI